MDLENGKRVFLPCYGFHQARTYELNIGLLQKLCFLCKHNHAIYSHFCLLSNDQKNCKNVSSKAALPVDLAQSSAKNA